MSLGKHVLMNITTGDIDWRNITTLDRTTMFESAAKRAGATVVYSYCHEFAAGGAGTSGVIVLAESHLTWHEWPEHNYVAVDIFVCGEQADPMLAIAIITDFYSSENTTIQLIMR